MEDALKVDLAEQDLAHAAPDSADAPDLSADAGRDDAEKRIAIELARLLQEHKGGDVVVIDLRQLSVWTDFFVIATVSSGAHLSGLQRRIKEFADENNLPVLRGHRRTARDNGWDIYDLGFMAVHLMMEAPRSFYELENLWSGGGMIRL
ncbi:MAG: ribosome silencing factor [Spirochaetaceae bacterium]|jgi:ribosome-associated protein|nr:ribosome silencing factor [Spirochaetaceae bacterium]